MKKKILYLITKSNYGGAQRYVFDLATNLDPKKYEVGVILGAPRDGESGKGVLLAKLRENKIRTIVIPELGRDIKILDEIKVFIKLVTILREERPDVLHVNSSKGGGLGSFAGRLVRIKRIIFTVHGFAWNEPRPKIERRLIKFLSWLTLFFSNENIFVVSKDLEVAQTWPLVKNKLRLIYNGIAESRIIPKTSARSIVNKTLLANNEQPPAEESIWIGSITEFIKNKGVEFLIEAFAKLLSHGQFPPNAHLILIGGGARENAIRQYAEELGVEPRVHFAGFVPNASHLLPAFDMLAISSLKEGLPYVVLEAAVSKTPLIATEVGEISNVVDQGETGLLVPPGNSEMLARALFALASDENTREMIAKNAYKKIRTDFSIEQMLEKTVALY